MAKRNDIPQIQTQPRPRVGSRYAARLRREGQLPAVVYGHKQDNVPITVSYRELTDLLHDNVHLVELMMDGGATEPCLIKDVQWDHLGLRIVHVDLARVDLSEEVEVEVEVELLGEPAALQESGAILNHPTSTITVRCRADQIPETISHDISELGINESITVADLSLGAGITAVTEPEAVVAQIQVMQEIPEEVEEPVAEGEEPEVIGRAEGEAGEGEE